MIYLSQLEDTEAMQQLIIENDIGFESYEFATGKALDDLPVSVERFHGSYEKLCGNGLSFHGPFVDLNPASFESLVCTATRTRFDACFAAARMLGVNGIVFHTGFFPEVYWTESWEHNSIEFWQEFFHDKDDSIQIYLENLYDPNPGPIARVLDAVNHPSFSACLDIGHVNVWSKLPASDWIEVLGERIHHLHLSNNDGKNDSHSALQAGTMNIPPLLEQMLQVAPHADWVIEVFGAQAAKTSLAMVIDCLKPINVSSPSSNSRE